MPKAYPSDAEVYEYQINERKEAIIEIVAETKWMMEFIALLAMNTALSTIFAVLMRQLLTNGPNPRLICGVIATFGLGYPIFTPTIRAIQLCSDNFLFKIRKFLHIPHDAEDRHICIRAAWLSLIQTIYIMAVWGTSLMLEEMVKHSGVAG